MTSNKTLLSRIGEWQTTRTGKFQTTGLERVDNAFATLISDIFSDVTLVEPAKEERRFASFLSRPPAERVYVARFDNAVEFLKSVRRANAGQGRKPENPNINRDALPLINISRSMDISYINNDQQIDRKSCDHFCEPGSGMPLVALEYTQANLTYDVTLMATDKATMSLMCNSLGARLRLMAGTQFEATTPLVRVPVPLICAIQDAKDISFTDVSAPIGEERIYAAQTAISVIADVITAWELDAKRIITETSLRMG
ncbi:baseplate [Escherichia coli]|uniref:hypothetical protein n=1 Tax=Escherichia coli TaxID=562 RepID=UPI0007A02DD4|nr:hypothetical protein [Escherichia coli]EKG1134778.1 baseplate [Escherichia coli]KYU58067.1 baseplate [Escherichia coli]HBC9060323.1 baseplate [Escherichia coli]HEA3008329.1 baseplate [Escherichia coli]